MTTGKTEKVVLDATVNEIETSLENLVGTILSVGDEFGLYLSGIDYKCFVFHKEDRQ